MDGTVLKISVVFYDTVPCGGVFGRYVHHSVAAVAACISNDRYIYGNTRVILREGGSSRCACEHLNTRCADPTCIVKTMPGYSTA